MCVVGGSVVWVCVVWVWACVVGVIHVMEQFCLVVKEIPYLDVYH